MIGVQLQPIDTWFFRDGTPFTRESTAQDNVGSLFPPHPPTTAGALRAALARSKGWSGRGEWSQGICNILGDGPENLGSLSFLGPILLRNEEPLFPAPRHLLGSIDGTRWCPSVFLRPGTPVTCDLGDAIRLPEAPSTTSNIATLKPGDACWLTRNGLSAVLHGHLPRHEDVIPDQCLWSDESRTGLEREGTTRTAKESMLYSSQHIRPQGSVSLGVQIAGLPQDWSLPFGQLIPLGGESRLAECQKWEANLALDTHVAKITETREAAVIALSPVELAEDIYRGVRPMGDLDGARVVSACLDRPLRIGGWNSRTRHPLPLRSLLPPGSVLFCEIDDPETLANDLASGGGLARIGARREWGFGLVAVGAWPDGQEEGS